MADLCEQNRSLKMQVDAAHKVIAGYHDQVEKMLLQRVSLQIQVGQLLEILQRNKLLDEVSELED